MSHYSKPILLMLLGSPGSGKSFFARSLAEKTNIIRINSDSMRRSIFGSIENMEAVREAQGRQILLDYTFNALNYVAEQIICRGQDLIYDAQLNKREYRQPLGALAERYGTVPLVVYVDTPIDVALQRGQTRETLIDQRQLTEQGMRESIQRFQESVEMPESDEKMVTIGGQIPFEEQLASFEEQLEKLL